MTRQLFRVICLITLFCLCAGCSGLIPARAQSNSATTSSQPVLLFGIGLHIEPFGAQPSALVKGAQPSAKSNYDLNDPGFYQRQSTDILQLAQIIEKHGGMMTVQAQSPFTTSSLRFGSTILSDLVKRGHEMALHFHEDAHLGKNSENLPPETWCAVMQEEIAWIKKASGEQSIRFWSGGNLYPQIFTAASCAGLDINSDWKNPQNQQTPMQLTGIHPWRPSGGYTNGSVNLIAQHNRDGKVIFLPEGIFDKTVAKKMLNSDEQTYYNYLKTSLQASLSAASSQQVNVFHLILHPGEFRGPLNTSTPFAMIERFLKEEVDPLVASGKIKWATFSEMADQYQTWEQTQSGAIERNTNRN